MTYIEVSPDKVSEAITELDSLAFTKPLPHTMALHCAVVPRSGTIATRGTSCFKACCYNAPHTYPLACSGWNQTKPAFPATGPLPTVTEPVTDPLPSVTEPVTDPDPLPSVTEPVTDPLPSVTEPVSEPLHTVIECVAEPVSTEFQVGIYVAAVYMGDWYVGRVEGNREIDGNTEYKVKYFAKRSTEHITAVKWGGEKDWSWVWPEDILCTLSDPIESGSRRKVYRFSPSDFFNAQLAFDHH